MVVCYQVWQTNIRNEEIVHQRISWANAETYHPSYIFFTLGDMTIVLQPIAVWKVKSPNIVYKSEYSKVCKIVGHQLPKTQEEENYCQTTEWESPVMAKKTRDRMISELDSLKKKKK